MIIWLVLILIAGIAQINLNFSERAPMESITVLCTGLWVFISSASASSILRLFGYQSSVFASRSRPARALNGFHGTYVDFWWWILFQCATWTVHAENLSWNQCKKMNPSFRTCNSIQCEAESWGLFTCVAYFWWQDENFDCLVKDNQFDSNGLWSRSNMWAYYLLEFFSSLLPWYVI